MEIVGPDKPIQYEVGKNEVEKGLDMLIDYGITVIFWCSLGKAKDSSLMD